MNMNIGLWMGWPLEPCRIQSVSALDNLEPSILVNIGFLFSFSRCSKQFLLTFSHFHQPQSILGQVYPTSRTDLQFWSSVSQPPIMWPHTHKEQGALGALTPGGGYGPEETQASSELSPHNMFSQ